MQIFDPSTKSKIVKNIWENEFTDLLLLLQAFGAAHPPGGAHQPPSHSPHTPPAKTFNRNQTNQQLPGTYSNGSISTSVIITVRSLAHKTHTLEILVFQRNWKVTLWGHGWILPYYSTSFRGIRISGDQNIEGKWTSLRSNPNLLLPPTNVQKSNNLLPDWVKIESKQQKPYQKLFAKLTWGAKMGFVHSIPVCEQRKILVTLKSQLPHKIYNDNDCSLPRTSIRLCVKLPWWTPNLETNPRHISYLCICLHLFTILQMTSAYKIWSP